MANLCCNMLWIKGDKKRLEEFDKHFKKKHMDCNFKQADEKYSLYNFVPINKDEFSKNWWVWNVRNLGTSKDLDPESIFTTIENDEYYCSFTTNWNPCENAVLAMSRLFPDLNFTYGYEEGGEGFAGLVKYSNGEEIYREETETDYRRFVVEKFGYEYEYKCADCSYPIDDYEYKNEHECPECKSKNIIVFK